MTSREQGGGSSFASPYASNYGDGGGSASPASSGSTGSSGSAGSTGSASTVTSPTASNVQNEVSKFAQSAEGKPYVYGAAGPNSFDCSGLSMQSWKQAGTTLPHNANAQYEALPKVPIAEAQVGDLVFFPGSDGNSTNPGHVGIVIDPAKHLMVSASTDGVALSKQIPVQNYMDEKGVYPTVGRPVAGKNYT
jgi:cell wall-associated NlpC family hydrolase